MTEVGAQAEGGLGAVPVAVSAQVPHEGVHLSNRPFGFHVAFPGPFKHRSAKSRNRAPSGKTARPAPPRCCRCHLMVSRSSGTEAAQSGACRSGICAPASRHSPVAERGRWRVHRGDFAVCMTAEQGGWPVLLALLPTLRLAPLL